MTTLTLRPFAPSVELYLPRLDRKVWLSLGLLCLGLLVYVSLWQNIRVVSSIYQLQQLQVKLAELQKENEILQANTLQANSLENLEQLVTQLNLEKVDSVQFISPQGNVVVTR